MAIDYDGVAELYDLYCTARYDVAFFVDELRRAGGPVLELAAGTGRLSLPLLAAGAELTCVDLSRGMLDVLARKLAESGFCAELRCGDVRDLDLPPRFALALFPFQSLMEIVGEEPRRAVLAGVHRALVPGGRFVCTLHNPPVRRRSVDGALRLVGSFPAPEGTLVVSGCETGGDPVVTRQQLFERYDATGRLEWKRLMPMEFELVEPRRLVEMAEEVGFRLADLYGSYDRAPFAPDESPVAIACFAKES